MTTKTPSSVRPAPENSLEKIAYAAAAEVPAREPHDTDRLGYNIYLFLKSRRDPLETTLKTAGVRLQVSDAEALARIRAYLKGQGITA